MTIFKRGVPVTTEKPEVVVDRLPLGRHVFQLVVVDDDGNESVPDRAEVFVQRSAAPGEPSRGEPVREEPVRGEPVRGEPVRGEPVREEPVREQPTRTEPRPGPQPGPTSPGRMRRPST